MNGESEGGSTNKTVIIVVSIIAGVILLVVAGCFGIVYFAIQAISPAMSSAMQMLQEVQLGQAVAQNFFADLSADRIDAAYKSTTEEFQKRMNLEAFRKFVAKQPNLKGSTANFTNLQITPGRIQTSFTASGPKGAVTGTLIVIKEGEEWKVDQFTIP